MVMKRLHLSETLSWLHFYCQYFGERNTLWPIKILILVHDLEAVSLQESTYSDKLL